MDSLYNLASGGSTIEMFSKEVFIRSNLTNRIKETIQKLLAELYGDQDDAVGRDVKIITEISSSAVNELVCCFEAVFLHGLKGKPFLNRVLGKSSSSSSVLSGKSNDSESIVDFWSVILILSHNQVSESLAQLNNIKTDIGKCRAWLRLTFNDNLLTSYIEALVNDSSLLHGFYRPSAYLRDIENVNDLRKLMEPLKSCTFQLNYDYTLLNSWPSETLLLIGIKLPSPQDISPVVAAVDALSTIRDKKLKRDAASKIRVTKNFQNEVEKCNSSKSAHISKPLENPEIAAIKCLVNKELESCKTANNTVRYINISQILSIVNCF